MGKVIKYYRLLVVLMLTALYLYGSTWWSTFGGDSDDISYVVKQVVDGSYLVVGETQSFGAGNRDVILVKFDTMGNEEWMKTYGGTDIDIGRSLLQLSDGGFLIGGSTRSFGNGAIDFYLIRTDSTGDTIWTRAYGTSDWEQAYAITQTPDGGFVIAGWTDHSGGGDAYIIKTDQSGNITWDNSYGDPSNGDWAYDVQTTSDGGYIVTGFSAGDVWLLKLGSDGSIQWQKSFGTSDATEIGYSVQQTIDGGYIIAGYTSANGGDVYIIKTDSYGNITWVKAIGGSGEESASHIEETSDAGYIITGYTTSFGNGGKDVYILRLTASGDLVWERTYGGNSDDEAYYIDITLDSGYIVAGYTNSFGQGGSDIYLVKTDSVGTDIREISSTLATGPSASGIVLNRSQNQLTFNFPCNPCSKEVKVGLYDVNGRVLSIVYHSLTSGKKQEFTVSLNDLLEMGCEKGIYLIKVDTGNYSRIWKLLLY